MKRRKRLIGESDSEWQAYLDGVRERERAKDKNRREKYGSKWSNMSEEQREAARIRDRARDKARSKSPKGRARARRHRLKKAAAMAELRDLRDRMTVLEEDLPVATSTDLAASLGIAIARPCAGCGRDLEAGEQDVCWRCAADELRGAL